MTSVRVGGGAAGDRERDKRAGLPRFYSAKDVAEMLGVSMRSVRRWIERGELVVHRLGSAVRISDADLKTFLAVHRDQ